jgi:hypothetical protein
MRRTLVTLSSLALLLAVVGCHHMAGVCDCDFTPTIPCPCWLTAPHGAPGAVVAAPLAPTATPAPIQIPAEPIKVMPKTEAKPE